MPIQLAESMWVNLKKKVSMDMFTLENSKKRNGEGTLTRPEKKKLKADIGKTANW